MSTYHEAVAQEQAERKAALSQHKERVELLGALAPEARYTDIRWLARNCGGPSTFEALLRVLAAK